MMSEECTVFMQLRRLNQGTLIPYLRANLIPYMKFVPYLYSIPVLYRISTDMYIEAKFLDEIQS